MRKKVNKERYIIINKPHKSSCALHAYANTYHVWKFPLPIPKAQIHLMPGALSLSSCCCVERWVFCCFLFCLLLFPGEEKEERVNNNKHKIYMCSTDRILQRYKQGGWVGRNEAQIARCDWVLLLWKIVVPGRLATQ